MEPPFIVVDVFDSAKTFKRPAVPAAGMGAARPGAADAPDRRAAHAPRPGPARPLRPARRRPTRRGTLHLA